VLRQNTHAHIHIKWGACVLTCAKHYGACPEENNQCQMKPHAGPGKTQLG